MLKDNILHLRKMKGMSQEELANELNVSRQTLSKWETGESVPDLEKSKMIADFFGVSLDALASHDQEKEILPIGPAGKHIFGMVKVGEKGQIVIPAKAREIFGIKAGDNLIVLGDENQGLAILVEKDFMKMVEAMKAMPVEG